jgi:hypothetical protein
MSLDVYLRGDKVQGTRECSSCGHRHQRDVDLEYFEANITHNLGRMADAAGIYYHLWRPDEIGVTVASQLIEPLRNGLRTLESEPQRFKKLNPDNGWGTYDSLVRFVRKYLRACEDWPDATVLVSR